MIRPVEGMECSDGTVFFDTAERSAHEAAEAHESEIVDRKRVDAVYPLIPDGTRSERTTRSHERRVALDFLRRERELEREAGVKPGVASAAD